MATPSIAAAETNRNFYDGLWSQTRLADPERFNTWPLISSLVPAASSRLEIGPGLRPRLPIAGTRFIDISAPVIEQLNGRGGFAEMGDLRHLPYPDESFDLVCAFDVIEHTEDDLAAFAELSRVLRKGGTLIFSVPLHKSLWNSFDAFCGHVRRYDPADLSILLKQHGLSAEKSAVFGLQPSSPRLLDLGIWFLTHHRSAALFWYNNVFLPLRLLFQKRLLFAPGIISSPSVDEIVLLCRRDGH